MSAELRDLITTLARHYHRVILDAPAVLGLADGRILGSLADATLLVVRSGTHEMGPLQRAKETLEQTRARIAGVVFNDLSEGLDDWSSYGSSSTYRNPRKEARPEPRLGLVAPRAESAA